MSRRALDQQRAFLLQHLRPDQLVLGRHRADADRAAFLAYALELRNLAEVDQMARLREAHLHHRQQAMAAREKLRLVAELREQAKRVGNGLRRVILEFAGDHRSLLQRSCSSANTPLTHRNKTSAFFSARRPYVGIIGQSANRRSAGAVVSGHLPRQRRLHTTAMPVRGAVRPSARRLRQPLPSRSTPEARGANRCAGRAAARPPPCRGR